jgi:hypothetical protein
VLSTAALEIACTAQQQLCNGKQCQLRQNVQIRHGVVADADADALPTARVRYQQKEVDRQNVRHANHQQVRAKLWNASTTVDVGSNHARHDERNQQLDQDDASHQERIEDRGEAVGARNVEATDTRHVARAKQRCVAEDQLHFRRISIANTSAVVCVCVCVCVCVYAQCSTYIKQAGS